MKNLFLTLFGGFLLISSTAQSPVITSSNVHLIGDETPIAWCSNAVSPGDEGADVTWDLSGLSEVEEQIFTYVDPNSSVFGYQFPNATLCGIGDNNFQSFYRVSNDYLIVEGYAGVEEGTTDTLKILYSDEEELLPIPFEFGTTNFDTFSGVNQAFGFEVSFTGEIDLEVDGYGTLILPNGTYENAVRYHFTREQNNTVLGQTTTTTKEQWGWMSPNHRFWLCLMEINDDGFGTEEIVWYSKNPLVLGVQNTENVQVQVYPNPLQQGSQLHFRSALDLEAQIQLFNMNGSLVQSTNQRLIKGENTLNIQDQIPTGIYTLNILTEQQNLVSRIVIQ